MELERKCKVCAGGHEKRGEGEKDGYGADEPKDCIDLIKCPTN